MGTTFDHNFGYPKREQMLDCLLLTEDEVDKLVPLGDEFVQLFIRVLLLRGQTLTPLSDLLNRWVHVESLLQRFASFPNCVLVAKK